MITITIINHTLHECYIENVNDDVLAQYRNIEAYIKDNYNLKGCKYSFDYVSGVYDYSNDYEEVRIELIG